MTRITLAFAVGLPALVLSAGAALAQGTPPSPPAPGPAKAAPAPQPPPPPAPTPPAPGPNAMMAPNGQPNAMAAPNGPPNAMAAPNGPPEGMVVETPNGFYLIRPGDAGPRRLDLGRPGPAMGQTPQPGDDGPEMAGEDGMRPRPGPMGMPMPPPPPPSEGKGARFSIKTPNLDLSMKCPEDEPIKSCVDAVSQLLDKANAPGH